LASRECFLTPYPIDFLYIDGAVDVYSVEVNSEDGILIAGTFDSLNYFNGNFKENFVVLFKDSIGSEYLIPYLEWSFNIGNTSTPNSHLIAS